jgi:Tfp pilus assembly protein PilF
MKRLLTLVAAALLTLVVTGNAQSPDDQYIQIYRTILDGDQLAANGQTEAARQKYTTAQADLKRLQANFPQWNEKLVEFRLRNLERKLGPARPAPAVATPEISTAPPRPGAPPAPPKPEVEADDRDHQIRLLQDQVARLHNDRTVLEARLREALAAQPAAVDPRELVRAEARVTWLEKEKEVLRVSLAAAEAKAEATPAAAELQRALADARQRLNEQNDAIIALRQEKDLLQRRVQAATRPDEEALRTLRAENDNLKTQLAQNQSAASADRGNQQLEKELASTKAALQSSRETMASLQIRLRTLQEERDGLESTRKELETKIASAPAPAPAADSAQVRRLQKERDDLEKRLNETRRQLADNKSRTKQARADQPSEELVGLRAKLAVYEARQVPYTPEELALFQKPIETVALTRPLVEQAPSRELPASAAPLLAEAHRAFTARRFDEAEQKYLEVLKLDDRHIATLQRLAAAQLEQNRPADAESTLARALELNSNEARTLLLLGIAKFDQDKYDDALTSLSRCAQVDPQNAEAQNYLGITLSQKGQRAAAETALRKAIQLAPSYNSAHYNLAVVYATQQPPFTELARWHYQKALAFGHPQNADFERLIERRQTAAQQ